MYGAEGIYFVTARTVHGRLLMRPSPQVRDIVGGILARAARRYGVALRGFVVMSNHLHLLVRAQGVTLSRFMQFVLANVARKLGVLHAWRGPFWQRRFSCEPVLDVEAELERLRYILSHGVKERLVAHHSEWPGLSCLKALLGANDCYPFFNWDWRWQRPALAGVGRWSQRLVELERLELEPITAWAGCDGETRALFARQLADQIAQQHAALKKPVLGVRAVLRQPPHRPVTLTPRLSRPLCHASSRLVRVQWLQLSAEYRRAYREASIRYRAGDRSVEFPPWAFAPPPGTPLAPEPLPTAERGAPERVVEAPRRGGVEKHVFHPTDD